MKKTFHFKRVLHVALLFLFLGAFGLEQGFAHDFMVDSIYYNIINSSAKTVEVTNRDGNDYSYSGDVIIPGSVSYGGYVYSVTRIGYNAFSYCSKLTSINIPNSVTEIGNLAFLGCSRLSAIDIPNSVETIGVQAFYNCKGLTTITIPESVKVVKGYAFGCCQNLSTVDFNAANCTQMGDSSPLGWREVFYECTSLTTLNIGETVESIPENAFYGCLALSSINIKSPISIVDVRKSAFVNTKWYNDQSDGPLYLDNWLLGYKGNKPSGELIIREGTVLISAYAFSECINLTSLLLPNTLISIGSYAFYKCSSLEGSLIIPNSVIEIGELTFVDCSGFTGNLILGNSMVSIGVDAFNGCSGFTGTLIIPNTVTEIGDRAFAYCRGFTGTLTISKSVETIGNRAFHRCEGISVVDFCADNCLSMEESFRNCSFVTVNIGENVQSIPANAFKGCSTINTIIAYGSMPPTLGSNAFSNISSVATLFVPCGSQMAYFSSWNVFDYNNIHEDCTPRPVLVDSNVTGGTITPSVSEASMGQEVTFTVSPNPLMELVSVTAYNTNNLSQLVSISPVDGTAVPTYKFNMPMFGVTLSATFEHASTYSISLSQGITGGSVSFSTSEALAGETISLSINPDPGYELRSLSVYNINNPSQTVSVTNNTFIMPSFDVMVSAEFVYTSVDESEINPIAVYPNPTSGVVRIEAENLRHISVFNELGQQVYDGQAEGNEFEIYLSSFESGVYLVRIETASGITTKQVVVTK